MKSMEMCQCTGGMYRNQIHFNSPGVRLKQCVYSKTLNKRNYLKRQSKSNSKLPSVLNGFSAWAF